LPSGVYERTEKIIFSKEHRQNISKARQGTKLSCEIKQKISEGNLGKEVSDETRHSMSEARIGMIFSEEHKLNISKAHKKRFAKMTEKQRREYFKYLLLANQATWDQMTKEEKTERSRHWFEAGIIASQKANPSSIERMIWKELDKLNIKYKTQVLICGGMFILDICFLSIKVVIECNGTFWHNYEIFPERKIRDNAVDKWAARNSYKIIWLWESEIRKDPKQALENGLKRINLKNF